MSDNPQDANRIRDLPVEDKPIEWLVSKTGLRYYYLETPIEIKEGKSYGGLRLYENGTKYREPMPGEKRGRIAGPPPNALITPEKAKDMQAASVESRNLKPYKGMELAVSEYRKGNPNMPGDPKIAWGYAVMKAALAHRSPQQSAMARLAGETMEIVGKQGASVKDAAGNELRADNINDLMALADALRARRREIVSE